MFGWFRKDKDKKERQAQLKELRELSKSFTTLERLQRSGLLWFDEQQRRLMIEQQLAVVMVGQGPEGWRNFLQRCFTWQYEKECSKAWQAFIQKEELKALRMAIDTGSAEKPPRSLSIADMERVKEARRAEILQSEMQPPKVEGFEFFVVALSPQAFPAGDRDAGTVPGGVTKAVGWYHPDEEWPEMALWEDVKHFLDDKAK